MMEEKKSKKAAPAPAPAAKPTKQAAAADEFEAQMNFDNEDPFGTNDASKKKNNIVRKPPPPPNPLQTSITNKETAESA